MDDQENKNRLTSNLYWALQYKSKIKKPKKVRTNINLAIAELDRLFRNHLPRNDAFKLLEVGCAPGAWMAYFSKNFNYQVDGIEYTQNGVELTRQNLKLQNITGHVFHQDFLNNDLPKESYDVVFSAGFIEHFKDPSKIIQKHIELLKRNGYLILEIPNYRGINGKIQSKLNPKSMAIHNTSTMDLDFFKDIADTYQLATVYIGYCGLINFCMYSGPKIITTPLCIIHRFLTVFYLLFRKRLFIKNKSFLSPYIVSILKKQ